MSIYIRLVVTTTTNGTIKVILDTRKTKADGSYPIYYRVTEKKKVFYLYSGFSIPLSQWI
ncbi:MAG: hypothetical protein EOP47_02715 [Sphingobacteriaceae bacterium]|nr:MAG: hypothetical protein EOP47_02715 [Sphingobacteriaceae bacterium]